MIICDIFVKNMNKLSLFESYLNNLKDSLALLDQICETQPLFKSHLENIDQKVNLCHLSLTVKPTNLTREWIFHFSNS